MAFVQAIKKGPSIVNCSDFAQAFVRSIRLIMSESTEGSVIFDRYIDNSLKAQTRGKRSAGIDQVKFHIKDSTNIKLVPLKILLPHTDAESQLTQYLGSEYADSSESLVVV